MRERQDFAIQQNTLTLRNRVNELGVAEAVVQRQGLDRILVRVAGHSGSGRREARARFDGHARVPPRRSRERCRRGRAPRSRTTRPRAAAARGRHAAPAAARHHRVGRSARGRALPSYSNGQPVGAGTARRARGAARCSTPRRRHLGKPHGGAVHRGEAAASSSVTARWSSASRTAKRGHQRRAHQRRVLDALRDQRRHGVRVRRISRCCCAPARSPRRS